MSARDLENRISRPKVIQFDGVDVSRRPKCDCDHDYYFQYFFFTEVSRGASRTRFFFFSFYTTTVKNQWNSKQMLNMLQKHDHVQILACIMRDFGTS